MLRAFVLRASGLSSLFDSLLYFFTGRKLYNFWFRGFEALKEGISLLLMATLVSHQRDVAHFNIATEIQSHKHNTIANGDYDELRLTEG